MIGGGWLLAAEALQVLARLGHQLLWTNTFSRYQNGTGKALLVFGTLDATESLHVLAWGSLEGCWADAFTFTQNSIGHALLWFGRGGV